MSFNNCRSLLFLLCCPQVAICAWNWNHQQHATSNSNGHIWYSIWEFSWFYLIIVVQIDLSKELLGWVKKQKYALLDVNLYPKASDLPLPVCVPIDCFAYTKYHSSVNFNQRTSPGKFWYISGTTTCSMNFPCQYYFNLIPVRLSGAENIIILGHGPGCKPLVELVNHRGEEVIESNLRS